jgi:uncharacterized protein
MNRIFGILLVIIVFFALDYYFFQSIRHLLRNLSATQQRIVTMIYWAIPVVAFTAFMVGFYLFPAYLTSNVRNFLGAGVFIIYSAKLLALPFLLLDDIGRGIQWLVSFFQKKQNVTTAEPIVDASEKISRSDFLTKTALAVGGLHVCAMTWGIISGAHDYRIRKVTLRLKNLPRKFDGLKIAQLSDIHSGSFFNKTAVKGGVEMLLNEKPDLVFFTGDLVNNEAKEVKDYIDIFGKVKAPLGVYSTLGNHDYGDYIQWKSPQAKIENLNDLKKAHQQMGWNLLLDEHRPITVEGESIGILGIQNWGAGGFAKYGNLDKALLNTEDYSTKLLLSHDPSHWREQVLGKTTIDAAFAGHTHGMQYGVEIGDFKWSPVQFRYKEWAGLYQENDQNLYVNRGFGYIGYPGRVGILPEITVIELQVG